jgi:hypothetical protein
LFIYKIKMFNTMCKESLRVSSLLTAESSPLFNDWPRRDPAVMDRWLSVGRRYDHFGNAIFDSPATLSSSLAGLSWSP